MTTRVMIVCENCGADSLLQNQGSVIGWWRMTPFDAPVTTTPQDVCPACVAKLRGWFNPVIAGTARRVREMHSA